MMEGNLILGGIIVLWSTLMFVLGRNVFLYYKKRKWPELIVFSAIMLTIAMLSGGMILIAAFAIVCNLGLDLPCLV